MTGISNIFSIYKKYRLFKSFMSMSRELVIEKYHFSQIASEFELLGYLHNFYYLYDNSNI